MRVMCGFRKREEDLSVAVRDTLTADSNCGCIEDMRSQISGMARTLGDLLSLMVDKGQLTLKDVNDVVDPLYPFEEVKS